MLGMSGDVAELEGDLGPRQGVSSRVAAVANFFGVSKSRPRRSKSGGLEAA